MVDNVTVITTIDNVCRVYHSEYSVPNETEIIILASLLAVFIFNCLFGLFILRRLMKRNQYLKRRTDLELLYLTTLGVVLGVSFFLVREAVGRNYFPCVAFYLIPMISIPLVAGPILVRMVVFRNKMEYYSRVSNVSLESLEEALFEATLIAHLEAAQEASPLNDADADEGILSTANKSRSIGSYSRKAAYRASRHQRISSLVPNGVVNLSRFSEMSYMTESEYAYKLMGYMAIPIILYGILRISLTEHVRKQCTGCIASPIDYAALLIFISAFAGYTFYLYRVTRHSPDTLGILYELIFSAFTLVVSQILSIILSLVDPANVDDSGIFSFTYISVFGLIMIQFIQVSLPIIRLKLFKFSALAAHRAAKNKEEEKLPDFGYWNPRSQGRPGALGMRSSNLGRASQLTLSPSLQMVSNPTLSAVVASDNGCGGSESPVGGHSRDASRDTASRGSDLSVMSIAISQPLTLGAVTTVNTEHTTTTPTPSLGASSAAKSKRSLFASTKSESFSTSKKVKVPHFFGSMGPNGEYLDSALSVLMHDPVGRILFLDFTETEFSSECPRFLDACEKFRSQYEISSEKERYRSALRIYSLFVFSGSILQVNLSSDNRQNLDMIFSQGYGPAFKLVSPEVQNQMRRKSVRASGVIGRASGAITRTSGVVTRPYRGKRRTNESKQGAEEEPGTPELYKKVLAEVKTKYKNLLDFYVDIPIDVFDLARDEIFLMMCNDSYPRFRESDSYYEWSRNEPASAARFPKGSGSKLILAPSPSSYVNALTGNTRPMSKRFTHVTKKGVKNAFSRMSITAEEIKTVGRKKRESVFGALSGSVNKLHDIAEKARVRFAGDEAPSSSAASNNLSVPDKGTFVFEAPDGFGEEDEDEDDDETMTSSKHKSSRGHEFTV